ncbi:Branched-chain amino acid transport system ATP-binding protein [Hyphomicrobiales bacterium]|nr:Branched-chain amino acid transport system ATP-binding protein [Hyphomicrobiales bacterium]CAH1696497.1 Branched-chain amino acid transport system ATP-binding protein [Hyphomicrobiales bacterium]
MSTLLQVEKLSKSFGGIAVARNVSMSLAPGARVALIGPNGAGKTTFVNLVTGALAPSEGTVVLDGVDVTRSRVAERVRRGLVRTFQVSRLFRQLKVIDNVALAVLQREGLSGKLFGSAQRDSAVEAEAFGILDALGISFLAGRRVGEIAYGQQRLLELAMALALRPKVLLLDEPAAGVPHDQSPLIIQALERLPQDIAVMMIEHDMDLVFRFARKVAVLAGGELIFKGPPEEVSSDARVREAYLGSYAHGRR